MEGRKWVELCPDNKRHDAVSFMNVVWRHALRRKMLMTAHDIGLQLDDLSDWELPPSSAGDMQPVRAFDSAEAALRVSENQTPGVAV